MYEEETKDEIDPKVAIIGLLCTLLLIEKNNPFNRNMSIMETPFNKDRSTEGTSFNKARLMLGTLLLIYRHSQ